MYALKQLSRFLREKQCGTDGGDASSELCNEKRHDKIRIGAERKSHMCGDGRCGGDEESCVYNLSALVHFFHHCDRRNRADNAHQKAGGTAVVHAGSSSTKRERLFEHPL